LGRALGREDRELAARTRTVGGDTDCGSRSSARNSLRPGRVHLSLSAVQLFSYVTLGRRHPRTRVTVSGAGDFRGSVYRPEVVGPLRAIPTPSRASGWSGKRSTGCGSCPTLTLHSVSLAGLGSGGDFPDKRAAGCRHHPHPATSAAADVRVDRPPRESGPRCRSSPEVDLLTSSSTWARGSAVWTTRGAR